jgi:hypothetical protein
MPDRRLMNVRTLTMDRGGRIPSGPTSHEEAPR